MGAFLRTFPRRGPTEWRPSVEVPGRAGARRAFLIAPETPCGIRNFTTAISDPGAAPKTPKKRCRPGAEVPVLVPFSFPRIVTVFPFLHSWSQGTGRRTGAKTEARKRKETPSKLGVSWKNTAF